LGKKRWLRNRTALHRSLPGGAQATPRSAEVNRYLGEAYRLKGVNDSAQMFLQRAVELNDEIRLP